MEREENVDDPGRFEDHNASTTAEVDINLSDGDNDDSNQHGMVLRKRAKNSSKSSRKTSVDTYPFCFVSCDEPIKDEIKIEDK